MYEFPPSGKITKELKKLDKKAKLYKKNPKHSGYGKYGYDEKKDKYAFVDTAKYRRLSSIHMVKSPVKGYLDPNF